MIKMSFTKESVNKTPIVDTVFVIVDKAKKAKEEVGAENVVDATIGSLYSEDGKLVALDTVFESLKKQDNRVLAKYATSFTGNPIFKKLFMTGSWMEIQNYIMKLLRPREEQVQLAWLSMSA